MLAIKELETGYGKKQVLYGISLEMTAGEIVSIIGPNGSGKSTILKSICGLLPAWKGQILFNGCPINGANPAQNINRGISFAPQGNRVFDELTVLENLEIGGNQLSKGDLKSRVEELMELFPGLKERAKEEGGNLSGGEQQMLAIARALMPEPKLLMLDEPSLGLSPNLVKTVFEKIVEINKKSNVAILIVEQKVREVLEICTKVYGIKLGKVAFKGHPTELRDSKEKLKQIFL